MPARNAQIPVEALRDLIGVCRALFAAWTASAVGPLELEELRSVGQDLQEALKLARETRADTLGHRAAWDRAEAAANRLGKLVGEVERLGPVVQAATSRVVGAPPAPKLSSLEEREAKKHHQRMRS